MKAIKDERIVSVLRQVQANAFAIMFAGLLLVLLYRQFYLQQSLREYADFLVVWFVGSTYAVVAAVVRGVDMSGSTEGSRKWLIPLGAGLMLVAVQLYQNVFHQDITLRSPAVWLAAPITFASGFGLGLLVQMVLGYMYRWWERKHLG